MDVPLQGEGESEQGIGVIETEVTLAELEWEGYLPPDPPVEVVGTIY